MKVNIKKYPRWVGPYQLTNFLVKLGMKESTQEKLVDFLDKIGVTSLCNKVQAYYSETSMILTTIIINDGNGFLMK
jgi:hypothetical protein